MVSYCFLFVFVFFFDHMSCKGFSLVWEWTILVFVPSSFIGPQPKIVTQCTTKLVGLCLPPWF